MVIPAPQRQEVERAQPAGSTRLVGGKYRLGSLLGEGGMGTVYQAEHTGLHSQVAVKLLGDHVGDDPTLNARFRTEAQATAAIHSDHVVAVTDCGADRDLGPFIVMELLDGESLASLIRREQKLSPPIAAHIMNQVLQGLAAAHRAGVVHRDLKPENVILTPQQDGSLRAKIFDFGISKFLSGATGSGALGAGVTADGAVLGTPRYMAPEQLSGEHEMDHRADLYSAGVMFYRMLTGQLPIDPKRDRKPNIASQPPKAAPPPSALNPEVSDSVDALIMRAISEDPDSRFSSADEMRSMLLEALPEARDPLLGAVTLRPRGAGRALALLSDTLSHHNGKSGPVLASGGTAPKRLPWWRIGVAAAAAAAILGVASIAYMLRTRSTDSAPDDLKAANVVKASAAADDVQPAGGAPLVYSIARYLPEHIVIAHHTPFARYLSEALGREVKLTVVEDFLDLEKRVTDGRAALAAMSAYSYVRATSHQTGLQLMATAWTAGGSSYEGYILARASSPVRRLQDLRGRIFCYVKPSSTSGYLYPRALLRKQGIDPDADFKATVFGGDHLTTLRSLHSGACDGAAVYASIFFNAARHEMPPQGFRILASTDRIPFDAYCAGAHVPQTEVERIRRALLRLKPGSDLAQRVLGDQPGDLRGFVPAKDADYDTVRSIVDHLDDQHQAPNET